MSRSISPSTKQTYGLQRVCRIWKYPRSTFYVRLHADPEAQKSKPGPKPQVSDNELLTLIQSDLQASPFQGEGHDKVHARLTRQKALHVGHNRVLRVMRENNLLSPFRVPRGQANTHDGTICTDRPDEMWGTDGTKVMTVEEGNVWIFAVIDHFNSECIGWHVCKKGDRFAALEPIRMGIQQYFGPFGPDQARGLTIRSDHGCQYTSDHFRNELRYLGIHHSLGFVGEPQTNGIAERFFRTLKEQIIKGRVWNNLNELRHAVRTFVDLYNQQWLLEKNGYQSPLQTREFFNLRWAA
jgi:transposase InsO family protein